MMLISTDLVLFSRQETGGHLRLSRKTAARKINGPNSSLEFQVSKSRVQGYVSFSVSP